MNDHHRYRDLAGAYVLGALEPAERRLFEDHLSTCPECTREVASLAPIPGLLAAVDPRDRDGLPAAVIDRAAARSRSEWDEISRSRRRWRWVAAAAVIAVAVLTGVTVASRPAAPAATATPLTVVSADIGGAVTIDARAWGTALRIDIDGLPQRDRYVAWVIDETGEREVAATWGPTPAGIAKVNGASSIPAGRVVTVEVTDGDGTEVLVTALAE